MSNGVSLRVLTAISSSPGEADVTLEPLGLSLFGSPRFTGCEAARASKLLSRPKSVALLAYLSIALPRGLKRRDDLLAMLWTDSDPAHGRNSLRQSLHRQRSHLPVGSLISRGSDEIGISAGAFSIDIALFEEHLDRGREEDALALYGSQLLFGFHLSEGSEFDAWLDAERDRLHRRAVRAALVLAKRSELDGDASRAAEWARFAVDRAPFDESVLRDVIELLLRLGNKGEAARAYSTAVSRFGSELGVRMSNETTHLGARLSEAGEDNEALPGRDQTRELSTLPIPRYLTPLALRPPSVVTAEARHFFLEGRQLGAQRSPVTIMQSIRSYESAIRLSPDYAEAHSGLSAALCQACVYVAYPGTDAWPRVKTHASRAIRLDPHIGEAHAMLGTASLCYDYDWALAERLYTHALALEPNSPMSIQAYALYYLTSIGRTNDALTILDRARDAIPDLPGISVFYAMSCVFGRKFERGLQEIDFVLSGHPSFVQGYWVRGMAQEAMGDFSGAIETFDRGVEMTNGSSLFLAQLGRASAAAGDRRRATQILGQLDDRNESGGPGAYYAAEILAALGDIESALDRLYASYRQRNPLIIFAGVLFGLDPLRETRRFRDLLMRLGLPAYGREQIAPKP
ncbi:MAG: BTAD domain-containing putative transcriptional regulator [Gemmatimonadales bacterium]